MVIEQLEEIQCKNIYRMSSDIGWKTRVLNLVLMFEWLIQNRKLHLFEYFAFSLAFLNFLLFSCVKWRIQKNSNMQINSEYWIDCISSIRFVDLVLLGRELDRFLYFFRYFWLDRVLIRFIVQQCFSIFFRNLINKILNKLQSVKRYFSVFIIKIYKISF